MYGPGPGNAGFFGALTMLALPINGVYPVTLGRPEL
jgi:hypothetical protein